MPANTFDFLGDSTDDELATPGAGATAPGQAANAADAGQWARNNKATQTRDLVSREGPGYDPAAANRAFTGGNIGGSSGAYNTVSDKGRETFDYYRDIRDPSSVKDYLNGLGERVNVSNVGEVMVGGFGNVQNPLTYNPLAPIADTKKGLGTTADGRGGQPLAATNPAIALAGGAPLLGTVAGAAGDALGLGGGDSMPFDTSGADRGGMGSHAGDLDRVRGLADSARGLGADVLSGSAAPAGVGAQGQQDALDKAMSFLPSNQAAAQKKVDAFKPQAQTDVMTELGAFTRQPQGPSEAELLLDQAAQGSMADALSIARSGRARDAGSQARALNVATAENAATGVDTARNAGLLRAKEAQDFRNQNLQALQQKGALASGVDQSKLGALDLTTKLGQGRDSSSLSALGLGGDLATQLRTGNITERGQGLDFAQGQQQIGAGLEGDVLGTIPKLEEIRHADQYDLTPQQKLAQAKLAGGPEKTTADYVTGLLGDVLGVL